MNFLLDAIDQAETIAIGGHIRPDGDCIGSCMGLSGYIKNNYANKTVDVLLEEVPESFNYLKNEELLTRKAKQYDLFISLDCGDKERLGDAAKDFDAAKVTVNIDHHISNTKFGNHNHVEPAASSTCEVLYTLLEEEKIDFAVASALYTGIIHDTGVFKHSNTGRRTMEIAGKLMEKGIPFSKIIDESFYLKTYKQLQILGRCLLASIRVMEGKCIFSVVTKRVMEFYEAKHSDLEGVIDQMRTTEGVEVAILLDERSNGEFKVSMRSNNKVDVSEICQFFGGGGHVRAAGCTIKGSAHDVINNLTEHIEKQLS